MCAHGHIARPSLPLSVNRQTPSHTSRYGTEKRRRSESVKAKEGHVRRSVSRTPLANHNHHPPILAHICVTSSVTGGRKGRQSRPRRHQPSLSLPLSLVDRRSRRCGFGVHVHVCLRPCSLPTKGAVLDSALFGFEVCAFFLVAVFAGYSVCVYLASCSRAFCLLPLLLVCLFVCFTFPSAFFRGLRR